MYRFYVNSHNLYYHKPVAWLCRLFASIRLLLVSISYGDFTCPLFSSIWSSSLPCQRIRFKWHFMVTWSVFDSVTSSGWLVADSLFVSTSWPSLSPHPRTTNVVPPCWYEGLVHGQRYYLTVGSAEECVLIMDPSQYHGMIKISLFEDSVTLPLSRCSEWINCILGFFLLWISWFNQDTWMVYTTPLIPLWYFASGLSDYLCRWFQLCRTTAIWWWSLTPTLKADLACAVVIPSQVQFMISNISLCYLQVLWSQVMILTPQTGNWCQHQYRMVSTQVFDSASCYHRRGCSGA